MLCLGDVGLCHVVSDFGICSAIGIACPRSSKAFHDAPTISWGPFLALPTNRKRCGLFLLIEINTEMGYGNLFQHPPGDLSLACKNTQWVPSGDWWRNASDDEGRGRGLYVCTVVQSRGWKWNWKVLAKTILMIVISRLSCHTDSILFSIFMVIPVISVAGNGHLLAPVWEGAMPRTEIVTCEQVKDESYSGI